MINEEFAAVQTNTHIQSHILYTWSSWTPPSFMLTSGKKRVLEAFTVPCLTRLIVFGLNEVWATRWTFGNTKIKDYLQTGRLMDDVSWGVRTTGKRLVCYQPLGTTFPRFLFCKWSVKNKEICKVRGQGRVLLSFTFGVKTKRRRAFFCFCFGHVQVGSLCRQNINKLF